MASLTVQVSYKLNFTYMVRQPADGQWGIKEGGGWNGMIRSGQAGPGGQAGDPCLQAGDGQGGDAGGRRLHCVS